MRKMSVNNIVAFFPQACYSINVTKAHKTKVYRANKPSVRDLPLVKQN